MPSVFTKIINNELPAYRLYEDELVISFLALDQVTRGHALVIPKKEVNHWFDVPEKDFLQVQLISQKIAKALQVVTSAPRVLTATVGFEVPHYHLHLIPAKHVGELDFSKAKRLPDAEMAALQGQIREAFFKRDQP